MYHISATVLVPSSYAESPRGNVTSPLLLFLCLITCPLDSPQWFVSFPRTGLRQHSPFPNAVFAAALCNLPQPSPVCSAASDPHDSSLQLYLFTTCQDGGNCVPAASQTAGVSDNPWLTAVLRSRVTNCFSWGVMPLAQWQSTRTLMLPALCAGSSVWCKNTCSSSSLLGILLLWEENKQPDLPSCDDIS